ncbi:MAG: DUF2029 domain-containing protein [Tatlockia sp.]|nr:DUF2029 domain-containing protein [Tatlockia sp.]
MTFRKRIFNLNSVLLLALSGLYCLLFFAVLSQLKLQDFTSFYAALINYTNLDNPYSKLTSNFLPNHTKLTANLNPPFVLLAFCFLTKFSYQTALIIWLFLSLILGLVGAWIAFYYSFSNDFLKSYMILLMVIFLSFFSTIINISVGQMGLILLFFVMAGYHFYLIKQDTLCGIFWGLIIAAKFFPALLLIFALKQRRMKVFYAMLMTLTLAFLLAYFINGRIIYSQYFAMMSQVFWYGDNWNASIFGYFYRLFFQAQSPQDLMFLQQIVYVFLSIICLFFYLKNLGFSGFKVVNHQPFCLTLTMMLLMSPFGWLYYFPLLIFPLCLLYGKAYNELNFSIKSMLILLIILFLIGIPQNYINQKNMDLLSAKIIFFSFYFYGLLLLNYLCLRKDKMPGNLELIYYAENAPFIRITLFILIFNLVITALRFFLEYLN